MATFVFANQFKLKQHNGSADRINLVTDTIKVKISTATYVFSLAHDFIDDVTNEVSGTNYTAGGPTIAGVTFALDGNDAEFIHNDIVVAQSGAGFANGRVLVWYKDTGTPATSPIIGAVTEASDFGNVASPLTIDVDAANGVFKVS